MLVPLSWLEEYIEIRETPEEIASILTLSGLEVDAIDRVSLGFEGVVVGEITHTEAHPEADRLTVAQVSSGAETFQVVCGAPNCRPGIKTAFATIGAKLTTPEGEAWKIKKSKLRGVPSHGMLCAGEELGLSGSEGIMELDTALETGLSLDALYGDVVFEISLTPNLGHCLSIWGIARELSALLDRPMKTPPTASVPSLQAPSSSEKVTVSIEDQKNCWRYCALYVEGVTVGPSPEWMRKRLEMAGLRPVNNIVDTTNYVMLSCGQPMHAFDADTIAGNELIVRSLEAPVDFETLDESKREIPESTLVIADTEKPVAIAGVMGGQNSAVTEQTQNVILEAAHFCPSAIRRASKQLNLRSDSSARFERGVDAQGAQSAALYAAQLLQEIAGAKTLYAPIEEIAKPYTEKQVELRLARTNSTLGTTLSLSELEDIIRRMGVTFTEGEESFTIAIPSWRHDLREEIDLIEEVARIYGYNNIDMPQPKIVTSSMPHAPLFNVEMQLRNLLVAEGLQELLCCDLISPKAAGICAAPDLLAHVLKPSSIDQSVLRPSLLPGLLDTVKHNIDRGHPDLFGFEIGRIHYKADNTFAEKPMLGIILTGSIHPASWAATPREGDFFDIKGAIERALGSLGIKGSQFTTSEAELFHPGRQATVEHEEGNIGFIAEVHPETLQKWDIEKRVYYAHLDIGALMHTGLQTKVMQPLPLYPGSERDWTVTVDKEMPSNTLMQMIEKTPSRILKKATLLDLYESEQIGPNRKNLTIRFTYRDDKKTIAFETVEKEHARILHTLETFLRKTS